MRSDGRSEVSEDTKIVGDLQVDKTNLYREESLTDLKVASLRRLTPIKADGTDDPDRPTLFIGETQLMSQRGPLPIQSPIEASSLEDALDKFPDAMNEAVQRMVEEVREMQRQEANRIIVPGQPPPGKIQLG
jgi:hypothetical protein